MGTARSDSIWRGGSRVVCCFSGFANYHSLPLISLVDNTSHAYTLAALTQIRV